MIFRHETLVNIHLSVTHCDTNYLVRLLLSALFLSVSFCKYFHVCVRHDFCSLSNVSITVSPSALSLDVVPSVLRYLLAIKNCFYWLIKCFYFHLWLLCSSCHECCLYVSLVQKGGFVHYLDNVKLVILSFTSVRVSAFQMIPTKSVFLERPPGPLITTSKE